MENLVDPIWNIGFKLSSITSRCSGKEPALLKGARPLFGEERHERAAEIEPSLSLIQKLGNLACLTGGLAG